MDSMELLFDSFSDALIDSVKLIPFLLVTYLLMEWLEQRTEEKQKQYMQSAGAFGPLAGGALGIVPQCGFSCVAANLYSGGVITAGVVLAVFMSTSDEMLPIFISHTVNAGTIIRILLAKMCIAIVTGYAVDLANKYIRRRYLAGRKTKHTASSKNDNSKNTDSADKEKYSKHSGYFVQAAQTVNTECTHNGKSVHVHDEKNMHTHDEKSTHTHHGHIHYDGTDIEEKHIHDLCEQEHCNCGDGIWMSALKHTLKITVFILAVSFVLNIIIGIAGEDAIGRLLGDVPFLGEAMAALIGLIPNCAPSVIITELYLDGMLSAGAMMSGLLVSAGVGLLVLFRMNRQIERKHYGRWNLVCYQCVLGVIDQSVGYHILNRKNSENGKNGTENSNSYRGINRNWCSNGGSPCTTI